MSETRCTCGAGHATFGACMRAKNIRVAYCQEHNGRDATREKKWNRELNLYESVRKEGIQPAGTSTSQIREAMDTSDRTGVAFNADMAV